MMMVTKDMVKELRIELNEAVKKVAKQYNVGIEFGNASYSSTNINFKVNVVPIPDDCADMEEALFIKHAKSFGFNNDDYRREFDYLGETYELVGFNPKARKYPAIAEKIMTGAKYKFPLDVIEL